MVETPEPDCWLHPGLEVCASPIEGLGLFASQLIAAGTVVSRFGGRLVGDAELSALIAGPGYVDTVSVGAGVNLVLPQDSRSGKGNHSCDPNLWWVGSYRLATRRSLAAGDEATVDYGTITDDREYTLDCRCGTARCRERVTGTDWALPDLRDRYGDHCARAPRPDPRHRLTHDGPREGHPRRPGARRCCCTPDAGAGPWLG